MLFRSKNIGSWAFSSSGLTEIDIPEGVTIINEHAFDGCRYLNFANIPGTLTTLNHAAFLGCFLSPGSIINFYCKRDILQNISDGDEYYYEYIFGMHGFEITANYNCRLNLLKNTNIDDWTNGSRAIYSLSIFKNVYTILDPR